MRVSETARFVRQHDRAARTEVTVAAVKVRLIVRREIISQNKSVGCGKFQKAVPESVNLGAWIKGAIAGCQVKIPGCILRRTAAPHPDASGTAVGGRVEDIGQGERVRVVSKQPAVPGAIITMRREADVNDPAAQEQGRAVQVPERIERAASGSSSLQHDRPAKLFGARG